MSKDEEKPWFLIIVFLSQYHVRQKFLSMMPLI